MSPGLAPRPIAIGQVCGCRLKLNGKRLRAVTTGAFSRGVTNGTRTGFAGGAATIKEKRQCQWMRLKTAARPTPSARWPVMSRNGAPIGISRLFISAMLRGILRRRGRGSAASSAAAIAFGKTNSNFVARCAALIRLALPTFCSPESAALQIDRRDHDHGLPLCAALNEFDLLPSIQAVAKLRAPLRVRADLNAESRHALSRLLRSRQFSQALRPRSPLEKRPWLFSQFLRARARPFVRGVPPESTRHAPESSVPYDAGQR